MASDGPWRVRAVLQVLADLAPSPEQQATRLAIPLDWFRWLPAGAARMVQVPSAEEPDATTSRAVSIERRLGERLAAVDQVRAGERSLRIGWLFVAGRARMPDGRTRRVFHPLVTVTVRAMRAIVGTSLVAVGDAQVSDLVTDPVLRDRFERKVEYGGGGLKGLPEPAIPEALLRRFPKLHAYARELAAAAGLPATRLVPATGGPATFMDADELVVVAGVAVYAVHEMGSTRAGTLRGWSTADLDRWTALHSLYLGPPAAKPERTANIPSGDSPFLLTPAQRAAVERSRRDPVTLVSGAPGTGKSHTIAAIACDALRRRERVLVTAKTDATIDALLDLFERAPGLQPVVFGSSERREALADRFASGQLVPASDDVLIAVRERLIAATAARDRLRAGIAERLGVEVLATVARSDAELAAARLQAPDLFVSSTSLDSAAALAERAAALGRGWWSRRRRRKAQQALARLAGADPADGAVAFGQLARAVELARAERAWSGLVAAGGLEIGAGWEELRALDDEVRRLSTEWLAGDSRSARRLTHQWVVAALATALRSGRSARREQLALLDHAALTTALPLWVGTLPDIDDLLPAVPGMFDLVILDEASSIDQPLAAPALLRAERAVIVGDPRQLRHVSLASGERVRAALATHRIDPSSPVASRLDIRRNSTFDVAAGVSAVTPLTEHFRSDPHLVEFVAHRLYGGALHVATRTPVTEGKDCVAVVRLDGRRNGKGVVEAEVEHIVGELRALRRAGERSVGVVTPFRAQADALEEAVLAAFTADDLVALDLRVGTVHAFQGNERDVVFASLGLGPGDGPASWRFVDDPHLFTVFVTRARRRMTFVVSCDPPARGLVADYLAQADSPPGRPAGAGSGATAPPWVRGVADDLAQAGLEAVTGYPTGRHVIDLALGVGGRSWAVECGVHPDGPEAHIERHLALRSTGWEVVEAHTTRWADRPGELVVELIRAVGRS